MKSRLLSLFSLVSGVHSLTKICQPSFHDVYISGGDEINMRWEYCTKMTFKRHGQAEWNVDAYWKYDDQFKKLFLNYLQDHKFSKPEQTNPLNNLVQIELAVYDENGW
jgi:hypothetical protein